MDYGFMVQWKAKQPIHFTSDKYSKGRYTIKASGEYFEGTFKDGNPQEGIWYDANGNKLE